ncbi:ABC transporter C family member 7-like [Solanum pennellii]|uniref:ABC transporter C family member 7-like n=1 Tax=Solanum pennellii TaxID=28526 RepID=A0ABM1GVU1_SOLPN|nr:ABC transporter C family member 7-like [Solanum pennellii]
MTLAVGAQTGAHMFKKRLIQLLHEKPVVYATDQLEFLDASDLILYYEGLLCNCLWKENQPLVVASCLLSWPSQVFRSCKNVI